MSGERTRAGYCISPENVTTTRGVATADETGLAQLSCACVRLCHAQSQKCRQFEQFVRGLAVASKLAMKARQRTFRSSSITVVAAFVGVGR